jgi:hypothetical protein
LEHPNGLDVADGELVVAAWGTGLKDDFTTEAPGRLLAIDLATKAITPVGSGARARQSRRPRTGRRGRLDRHRLDRGRNLPHPRTERPSSSWISARAARTSNTFPTIAWPSSR